MYAINYDKKAISFLDKLPFGMRERIMIKIDDSQENPFRYFKKLKGKREFKLRVGDCRVIADIDSSIKVVSIRKIGHRKNIYGE